MGLDRASGRFVCIGVRCRLRGGRRLPGVRIGSGSGPRSPGTEFGGSGCRDRGLQAVGTRWLRHAGSVGPNLVTVLAERLDTAGRCWLGSGCGRSDRSPSQRHRSRTGPSALRSARPARARAALVSYRRSGRAHPTNEAGGERPFSSAPIVQLAGTASKPPSGHRSAMAPPATPGTPTRNDSAPVRKMGTRRIGPRRGNERRHA